MKTEGNDLINQIETVERQGYSAPYADTYSISGLTKREYFAAMAMQGMFASDPDVETESVVNGAVQAADALITALNK